MLNSAMLKVHRSSLSNTRSSLLMWSWPARPMFHPQPLSTYAKSVVSSHSVFGFSSFFSSGFASPGLVSVGGACASGASGFWKRVCPCAGTLAATSATPTTITPSHRVIRSSSRLDCIVPALTGSDAERLLERRDEHLPVPDAPRLGGRRDQRDDLVGHGVGDDDLHLHLGQEVDGILTAPVHLRVALLAAEAPNLAHGHADDAGPGERFLHVVQLERLDDRLDLLHTLRLGALSASARRPSSTSPTASRPTRPSRARASPARGSRDSRGPPSRARRGLPARPRD